MAENIDRIETPSTASLNVEGKDNNAVCPVCQTALENASRTYLYRRVNPDTRWFYCTECKGHLGYHRMKANWRIDPYDLETSEAFRTYFGVEEQKEE